MVKLDRALQRQILQYLSEHYDTEDAEIKGQDFAQNPDFNGNMKYLHEHCLITGSKQNSSVVRPGFSLHWNTVNINMNGLDILEDDGGLSAILRTVTVKFDADNLRMLITDKIIQSGLSESQRKPLIEKIKGLSSEALKQLALKLLEIGLSNPDKIQQLIDIIPIL